MPVFKLRMVRGFTLLAGITRGWVSDTERTNKEQARELRAARKRIKRQQRRIRHLQEKQDLTLRESSCVRPENIVWIFGTARTGSTWLGIMMSTLKGHRRWREPKLGHLFGYYFHRHGEASIFKSSYKETWLYNIRSIVLDGAAARFTRMSRKRSHYLVIQEPNGSAGAPWLLEALPESRMIFLLRDPRDVVASQLDAFKKGGWAYTEYLLRDSEGQQEEPDSPADTNPNAFVEDAANRYLRDMGYVKQAYDLHRGPKVIVRYEDLRTDTLDTMKLMYSVLGIVVDEQELAQAVDKHAWESITEDEKGPGKLRRKATPGGWREDLTPEQSQMVERITAPLLEEFYPR
jgi:hypothetical protein